MSLSIAQLRTPMTRAQALQGVIDRLDAVGFNASSWQSGSVQRTIIEALAIIWADASATIKVLAEAGFSELATGDLLTEFSSSVYQNTRREATKTMGRITLSDYLSQTGPHPIAIGQMVVADNVHGFTYRNIDAGTIPAGGAYNFQFEAETAGADRNVGNETIQQVVTPLGGIYCNNTTFLNGTWIEVQGTDQESDAALRLRNKSKWGTLSTTGPSDAYVNMALGVSGVSRVTVDDDNPRGAGTVDVYIAGVSGTATAQQVIDVQAVVDLNRPVSTDVLVIAAAGAAIVFAGYVYVEGALNTATKQTEIKDALRGYIDSLDIGGVVAEPIFSNQIPYSELYDVITSIAGVRKVNLTTPNGDQAILPTQVATTDQTAFMGGLVFVSV